MKLRHGGQDDGGQERGSCVHAGSGVPKAFRGRGGGGPCSSDRAAERCDGGVDEHAKRGMLLVAIGKRFEKPAPWAPAAERQAL